MKTKPRPLIVVDLLQKFISKQGGLGGAFDSADAFLAAMEQFLQDKRAKEAIRTAWLRQKINHALKDKRPSIPHEKVFADLRKRMEAALTASITRDCAHIRDDNHAIRIIQRQIGSIDECVAGLQFETFSDHPYMQATVERAITVIADVVRALSLSTAAKLDTRHVKELRDLAGRLHDLGRPVPAKQLWRARAVLMASIEKSLISTDSWAESRKPWPIASRQKSARGARQLVDKRQK